MAGYVYLIGSSTFKWYKIGKSSRAAIRVSELGILLPFRVEVIAVWKLSNYHAVERDLHEKYAANHINGEWFNFTDAEIKAIVDDMFYASTNDAAIEFTNMEQDYAPEGKIIKFKFKKMKDEIAKEPWKYLSSEEIDLRNWQRMVWAEFSLLTKEERKTRKREILDETQKRKKALKAKLLDRKTDSA